MEALTFEVSEERYQTALENQSNVVVPEMEERTVKVSTISATDVTPVLLNPFVIVIVETPMLLVVSAAGEKLLTFRVVVLIAIAFKELVFS